MTTYFFDMKMVENEIREDLKKEIPKVGRDVYRIRVIERAKAVVFIESANRKKYGKLLASIREQHSFKMDVYLRTLAYIYEMLSSQIVYNSNPKNKKENRNNTST